VHGGGLRRDVEPPCQFRVGQPVADQNPRDVRPMTAEAASVGVLPSRADRVERRVTLIPTRMRASCSGSISRYIDQHDKSLSATVLTHRSTTGGSNFGIRGRFE
jgi:hypothetical protein